MGRLPEHTILEYTTVHPATDSPTNRYQVKTVWKQDDINPLKRTFIIKTMSLDTPPEMSRTTVLMGKSPSPKVLIKWTMDHPDGPTHRANSAVKETLVIRQTPLTRYRRRDGHKTNRKSRITNRRYVLRLNLPVTVADRGRSINTPAPDCTTPASNNQRIEL
jgi:hypothetical protein